MKNIFLLIMLSSCFKIITGENKNKELILKKAIKAGNKEEVDKLIQAGVDFKKEDYHNRSHFMYACRFEKFEVAEALLNQYEDINERISTLNRALIYFCGKNYNTKIIEMLISFGANVNTQNSRRDTPLLNTLRYSNKKNEISRLLIENGADVNHENSEGYSALRYAFLNRYYEIIDLLLKKDINVNDNHNLNILFELTKYERWHEDILRLLVNINESFNVTSLLTIYKECLGNAEFINSFFIFLAENINISNIFTLDDFTFDERILFIDCLLYLIEAYELVKVKECKDLKRDIIKLFFEYSNGKLENNLNCKEKFINEYRVKKDDNIKFRSSLLIQQIYQALRSFKTEFTNEDLITKLEEIIEMK